MSPRIWCVLLVAIVGCSKNAAPQQAAIVKEEPKIEEKPAKADESKARYAERVARMKEAVIAGQVSRVLELLDEGGSVHDRDPDGETPLMWAAARGRTPLVLEFLARGADPTEQNAAKQTPLDLATANGHDQTAAVLRDPKTALDKRKDLPGAIRPTYGSRLQRLMQAAEKGRLSEVTELVKEGANVNDKDEQGRTALMLAAFHGHFDIFLFLLGKGANPKERDLKGRSVLSYAAEKGNSQILAAMYQPATSFQDNQPAYKAAGLTEPPGWEPLREGDWLTTDENGETPTHKLARAGNAFWIRAAQNLTNTGLAASAAVDNLGNLPLHTAAKAGHVDTVEALVWHYVRFGGQARFDHRSKNKEGQTPLMVAAACGHAEMMAAILRIFKGYSAQDNSIHPSLFEDKDAHGKTVLHIACERKDEKMIQILLNTMKPKDGLNRIHLVWENPEAMALLTAANIRPTREDVSANLSRKNCLKNMLAAYATDRKALDTLLGRRVNEDNSVGSTLLLDAVVANNRDAVLIILDSFGKNKEARKAYILLDHNGKTALDTAKESNLTEIVAELEKALAE